MNKNDERSSLMIIILMNDVDVNDNNEWYGDIIMYDNKWIITYNMGNINEYDIYSICKCKC